MKNNKPKFTPGPWIAQTKKGITTKNGLCNVLQERGPMFLLVDGVEHSEAEANAHLISAAPEMFEALEAALWLAVDQLGRESTGMSDHDLVYQINSALAKARGES